MCESGGVGTLAIILAILIGVMLGRDAGTRLILWVLVAIAAVMGAYNLVQWFRRQVDMAKKRLPHGDTTSVQNPGGMTGIKEPTSGAIRSLIRSLNHPPIARTGLEEAIESFAEDISEGHSTAILTEVVEVSLPPPIQLLMYQIAREAAMNALKHAEAEHIWITVSEREGGVDLTIRDDGRGFDTTAPPPEGHFGYAMMRERALAAGGTFDITSKVGRGTTIKATFPQMA
jgi:signal transduction histidine kinase